MRMDEDTGQYAPYLANTTLSVKVIYKDLKESAKLGKHPLQTVGQKYDGWVSTQQMTSVVLYCLEHPDFRKACYDSGRFAKPANHKKEDGPVDETKWVKEKKTGCCTLL
eukprot:TRINITY_DN3543_c0_g1_i3.p1 TRINITY_DN3543_c0_g1~~TRINITY_DN3543_c0_g1_i3.p1  ORF type:complete len:109 (+),score=18.41 TRINITY_DN3543_c0_g1_i3:288-614(+)